MAVASADLHQAINTLWNAHNLDWRFKVQWEESLRTQFTSLNDQEAPPSQPFPYCVYEVSPSFTATRMSGADDVEGRLEIRDVPVSFRVHSKQVVGNSDTAKKLAADLVEQILLIIGGHPTIKPKNLILDNGSVLIAQYQTDFGVFTDEQEYSWVVNYIFRLDVPVAA